MRRQTLGTFTLTAAFLLLIPLSTHSWGSRPREEDAKEPAVFSFLVKDFGRDEISDDLFVFDIWEEKLGIKIHPVPILETEFENRLKVLIAGGDIPDLCTVTDEIAKEYGPLGFFDDIRPNLDKLPDFTGRLERNPAVKEVLSTSDGKWYFFPGIDEALSYWVPAFRKDVLDDLDMSEMSINTLDDVYAYLKKAKGMLDNRIDYPWSPVSAGNYVLNGAPGLYGCGSWSSLEHSEEIDGFFYGPLTDRYRIFIQFLANCYREGLIHPETLEMSRQDFQERLSNGRTAFFHYPEYLILGEYNQELQRSSGKDDYVLVSHWPISLEGKAYPPRKNHPFLRGGSDVKSIYSGGQGKDAIYKFANFMYTEEGSRTYYWGQKGVHWDIESGVHRWKVHFGWNGEEVGKDAPSYIDFGLANDRYIFVRLFLPKTDPVNRAYDHTEQRRDKLARPLPIVSLTQEEREEFTEIMAPLKALAEKTLVQFITGRRPVSEYGEFTDNIRDMNIDRAIEIYDTAYVRLRAQAAAPGL